MDRSVSRAYSACTMNHILLHKTLTPARGALPRPRAGMDTARRSRWRHAMAALALAVVGSSVLAQDRLEVEQARQALARGAVAWDLRAEGAVLPGAARIAPQALQAWLLNGDTEALSRAVSDTGLNLSAEVLLVADDDATARAVAEQLAPLARGRLAWLAGGTAAWQAFGLPLQPAPTLRLPMPQHLVPAAPPAVRMATAPADAARRSTATFSLAAPALAMAELQGPAQR